jgi:uncharacterized RDD family membrane protein YckC
MATDGGGNGTRSNGQSASAAPVHPLDERYYVRGETEAYGPYEGRIVKEMIEQGKLLPGTGLARVGATEWTEIKDHPFFASLLRPGHVAAAVGQPLRLPGAPGAYQQAADGTRRYAGFWIRFVAYIVDIIAISILNGTIIGVVFAIVGPGSFSHLEDNSDTGGQIFAGVLLVVAYIVMLVLDVLYFVLFVRSRWQATPGKRLLGLYLITESGQPVSGWRALGRYFAYILSALPFYVGFMMIGWTDQKRGLHDMVCETRVVHGRL